MHSLVGHRIENETTVKDYSANEKTFRRSCGQRARAKYIDSSGYCQNCLAKENEARRQSSYSALQPTGGWGSCSSARGRGRCYAV
jgi:hypothetical protein